MPNHNAAGQRRSKHAKATSRNRQDLDPLHESEHHDERPHKKQCRRDHDELPAMPGSDHGRPPVKISFTRPNAAAQQTTNGVRDDLAVKEGKKARVLKIPKRDAVGQATQSARSEDEHTDKRILRSQDGGTRGSSELAAFFPEFYDIVYGEDEEPDPLNVNAILYLVDSSASPSGDKLPFREVTSPTSPSSKPSAIAFKISHFMTKPTLPSPSPFQTLDLSQYEAEALQFPNDPLADSEYLAAHRRGERHEKQLRNVEKERAVYEKAQLENILEGLTGPDWAKTMGLVVIDAEKKAYEPKRDHFVNKVRKLLAKFDEWKEKEKQLRQRKDRALAKAAREGDSSDAETSENEIEVRDPSALQLQQEAGLTIKPLKIKLRMPENSSGQVTPKPFTSFFAKPHERSGALAKHRRGRHVLAFGHPIPELLEEQEFEVPSSMIEEEKRQHRKSARRKRLS